MPTCLLNSITLKPYFGYSLQVIAEKLSEEEIAGLKEIFKMIDTDNSGQITFEELKNGLKRFGADLNESEIHDLMQAVSINPHSYSEQIIFFIFLILFEYFISQTR